uniref:Elongation factor 1-delta n=2 Tax=Lygus hesperus TaxID=30085 RepID=A0A0A9YTR7_LYGHE
MTSVCPLAQEKVWFDKPKYDLAEKKYYKRLAKLPKGNPNSNPNQSQAAKKDNNQPQNNPKQKEVSKQADTPCSKAKHPFEHPVKTVEPKSGPNQNKNATPKMAAQPHGKADAPVNNKMAPDAPVVNKVQPAAPPASVIPTDPNAPELTAKKESKKSKKTKKDRHRNRDREEKGAPTQNGNPLNSLAGEVAKARQHIKNSLQCIDDIANMTSPSAVIEVSNRLNSLEKENTDLKQKVGELTALLAKLEIRVKDLEKGNKSVGLQAVTPNSTVASQAVAKAAHAGSQASANVKTAGSQAKSQPAKQDDDDDGVDLFASESEEEDEEANKIKEQRLAEYAAKKSKKPALIAKSSIILDVKPWDDETDMKEMEKRVRQIEADGLLWGASKLVPLAYGIHKLQINCVVEDDKISIDWLQETIEEIEDYVQSVDIAAFNKI